MSSRIDQRTLSKLPPELLRLLANSGVNYWTRFGCLGISASVFVAWQYALRDGEILLAQSETWRWLDVRLPARAWDRTRRFLEENFMLKSGDERHSPWTIITSAFSHRDWRHFSANTLAFNTFSNFLGSTLPPIHFIGLILSTAVAGSIGFLFQQSRSKFPNRRIRALGMSGITSGIGVATAVFAPYTSVGVMGFPVPIWVALGGYTAWDMMFLQSQNSTTGHAAHLGGALAGLVYALVLSA